jgi:hypothetical protein
MLQLLLYIGSDLLLSTLVLGSFNLRFHLEVGAYGSNPYKTTDKLLYIYICTHNFTVYSDL